MAPPTLQWRQHTSAPYNNTAGSTGCTNISVLDYGNVQAGHPSATMAVTAKITGNSIRTARFWLANTAATGGNTSVAPTAWTHKVRVVSQSGYTDPAGIDWSGTNTPAFVTLGTDEPGGVSILQLNGEIDPIPDGGTTQIIQLGIQPPGTAGDGLTSGFYYRLSYLFS